MWSAGDNTEHGGGGFLDSTYNEDPGQSSKSDPIRGSAVVPLMIGHFHENPAGALKLWSREIKLVTVVAFVRKVERVTTKISYDLVDETGTLTAFQWIEEGTKKAIVTVPEGVYARVTGTPRESLGVPHIFILKIAPIKKMVHVLEHLLEVTYICLKGKEMFAEQDDNTNKTMAVTNDSENDSFRGMNREQGMVFRIIKLENESDTGIEKSNLKIKLPDDVRNKLDEILEFLVNEGHIYTTCTDDHFKTT